MKFDTHLHSKYSRDCTTDPITLVNYARKIGLGGIFITDHNTIEGFSSINKSSLKIHVICAEEIDTDAGEVIGLFLNEPIKKGSLLDVVDAVKSQDGFLLIPHPFDRLRKHLDPSLLDKKTLNLFNAIEIYNSRIVYFNEDCKKAINFASKTPLFQTAGSDEHFLEELGASFVEIQKFASIDPPSVSLEEIRSAFFKGEFIANGKPNSPLFHVGTKAVKFLKKNNFIK